MTQKLHPVIGGNVWCVPAAISVLTGETTDEVAKGLRRIGDSLIVNGRCTGTCCTHQQEIPEGADELTRLKFDEYNANVATTGKPRKVHRGDIEGVPVSWTKRYMGKRMEEIGAPGKTTTYVSGRQTHKGRKGLEVWARTAPAGVYMVGTTGHMQVVDTRGRTPMVHSNDYRYGAPMYKVKNRRAIVCDVHRVIEIAPEAQAAWDEVDTLQRLMDIGATEVKACRNRLGHAFNMDTFKILSIADGWKFINPVVSTRPDPKGLRQRGALSVSSDGKSYSFRLVPITR